MKIRFIFKWYDIWVGAFIDRSRRAVYIFPVPMFGFSIELKSKCRLCNKWEVWSGMATFEGEPHCLDCWCKKQDAEFNHDT